LFAAFALAFAVKVPLWPLHTWLPDAHVEAPTAGSVVLAGVLLKMGTFGFVRYGPPLFPEAAAAAAPVLAGLAIVGILYGAFVAFAQPDIKSLVAYSSVSHMGTVMLGIAAWNAVGLAGGTLQMVNHGLTTGALFLLVGMLYDRAHTREIAAFGGLWRAMPRFSALFLLVALASVGLPGTNGFVGEWLSLLGAFQARPLWGVLGVLGVLLGAVYTLTVVQRVFFGPPSALAASLPDLTAREVVALLPLVALILWIGLYPATFLTPIEAAGAGWLDYVGSLGGGALAGR
jgi:NADH-quinone oxidoreductase subunit M